MATPDTLNAEITKLIAASWPDITADLAANPKKASAFTLSVSLTQTADGSVSFVVRNGYRKQATISQPTTSTASGKLA
jgi:hypothetical protein